MVAPKSFRTPVNAARPAVETGRRLGKFDAQPILSGPARYGLDRVVFAQVDREPRPPVP